MKRGNATNRRLRLAIEIFLVAGVGLLFTGCGSVNMAHPELLEGKIFSFLHAANITNNDSQSIRCDFASEEQRGTATLSFTGQLMVSGQVVIAGQTYQGQSGVAYVVSGAPYISWIAEYDESADIRTLVTFTQTGAYDNNARKVDGSYSAVRYEKDSAGNVKQHDEGSASFTLSNCTN